MKQPQPSAWNAVPQSEEFWDNRFHYAEFRFMPTEARLLGTLVSVISLLG
jgi:hypothetical protein